MQLLKILLLHCISSMWLRTFLGITGNRFPLLGWSSENLMLLFVNAGVWVFLFGLAFFFSTLFRLWSGSRPFHTPLTSLLDSISFAYSGQWTA